MVQKNAAVVLDDPHFCSFPERQYIKARNDCLKRAVPAPAAPYAIWPPRSVFCLRATFGVQEPQVAATAFSWPRLDGGYDADYEDHDAAADGDGYVGGSASSVHVHPHGLFLLLEFGFVA